MLAKFDIVPTRQHLIILVDALARSGHFDEAEKVARSISPPDIVAWTTILGAYRSRQVKDNQRAMRIAQYLYELDPKEASTYILMANIHAMIGNWEEQQQTLELMKQKKALRIPGRSWITYQKTHVFGPNEVNHPAVPCINKQINEDLPKLQQQYGYSPDLVWVSKNLPEDAKKQDLCAHSERFAVYFGLLHVPKDKIIVVFNNLRVCGDCHAFTALLSLFYNREIRLRDASTWHIFKNGKCNCNGNY
jgi:hypothetical protein